MRLELKKKMIADVREKFGMNVDPAKVIEYLYENETLDDVLARKHLLKTEFFDRMLKTDHCISQIQEDLATDFSVDRTWVNKLVTTPHNTRV